MRHEVASKTSTLKVKPAMAHDSRMRIGVNGRFLTKPYTGIGQHTKYLFSAMAEALPNLNIIMVTPEKIDISMPKNVEIHVLLEKFPGTAGLKKTFWEQYQVPKFFMEHNVDVVHFPYPANPWWRFGKPICVTVHDTIPWEDDAYRRALRTRLYQDSCRNAVQKADHVFTVSNASKEDIVRVCGIASEKISLSYNAPAPQFFNKLSHDVRVKILQKYGLNPKRRYFFYIGGYDERKNVQTIISAFQQFIMPHYEVDLVLAGGKAVNNPLYASFDHVKHEDGKLRGKIHTTGFVEEVDLPALYQSAIAFVNISLKEGCNLPLLEALCSGVPVVTSNIPVHQEMVGKYAIYIEPQNVEQLGTLMDQFLRDEQFYLSQLHNSKHYRCPFSWEETAKKVFGVYEQLVKNKAVL